MLVEGGSLAGGAPMSAPCPRERADELATLRSFIARRPPTVLDAETAPSEPVGGGAALHRILALVRSAADEGDGYPLRRHP